MEELELELELNELLELAWFLVELELGRELFLVMMAAPELALVLFGDLELEMGTVLVGSGMMLSIWRLRWWSVARQ